MLAVLHMSEKSEVIKYNKLTNYSRNLKQTTKIFENEDKKYPASTQGSHRRKRQERKTYLIYKKNVLPSPNILFAIQTQNNVNST